MVGSFFFTHIINVSSSGKVVFKFMKGACHDSIGKVKGLFYSVSMVDININVEHSLVDFEEFENSQNTVINITEP